VFFQSGTHSSDESHWDVRTPRHGGNITFDHQFDMFYPEGITRPPWRETPSELFDSDLYLQRLAKVGIHPSVEEAIRLSLSCFQHELFVPCVAMLGAASEAAWIQLGHALTKRSPDSAVASKLLNDLDRPQVSTKNKMERVCNLYDLPAFKPLYGTSRIDNTRLRRIQQWSDQFREARNVLHWGATPSVPNSYEKVAVLLMDAVSEIRDLHLVKNSADLQATLG